MPEAGVRPSRIRIVAAMARMPSLKAPSRARADADGVLRRHLRNRLGGCPEVAAGHAGSAKVLARSAITGAVRTARTSDLAGNEPARSRRC